MVEKVSLKSIYKISEDVVARKVQEEFIIIPITSGIGDLEDEIYSLNDTGLAIWERLDGKRSLKDLAHELESEFEAPEIEIEKDVLGLAEELLKRKMLVEVR
ncbi:MAG: PqqD family protein [Candidatus Omnitrophica bacterium]|nr:PqqD family protein [Candidatus Omnitrophota bacterium]